MRNVLAIFFSILAISCSEPVAISENETNVIAKNVIAGNLFSLSDAEKILGEPAHLTDSASATVKGVQRFNSTYTANTPDTKSGKSGNVYFMFEAYPAVASAKEAYSSIKKANEDHEGIETLTGYGDEAYFHTDSENFYFILIRKNTRMLRLKVNKLTSQTSAEEFKSISKKMAENL
jgi:hypothetical protein